MSSSRWDRLEEAEELDTSEEPLLRREPLIDRIDLESASSNLRPEGVDKDRDRDRDEDEELRLQVILFLFSALTSRPAVWSQDGDQVRGTGL